MSKIQRKLQLDLETNKNLKAIEDVDYLFAIQCLSYTIGHY